jgi:hypothetical protein
VLLKQGKRLLIYRPKSPCSGEVGYMYNNVHQSFHDGPDQPHKAVSEDCAFISATVGSGRAIESFRAFLIPRLSRFTLSEYTVYYKNLWLITYACHAAGVGQTRERYLNIYRIQSQSA